MFSALCKNCGQPDLVSHRYAAATTSRASGTDQKLKIGTKFGLGAHKFGVPEVPTYPCSVYSIGLLPLSLCIWGTIFCTKCADVYVCCLISLVILKNFNKLSVKENFILGLTFNDR